MSIGITDTSPYKRLDVTSTKILIFLIIVILIISILFGALTTKITLKRSLVIIGVVAYLAFTIYRLDIFDYLMLFLFIFLFFHVGRMCTGILGYTLSGIFLDNTLPFWPLLLFLFIGNNALHRKLKIYRTPSDKWILLFLIVFTLSVMYAFLVVGNHWISILLDAFRYSRFIFLLYIIICVLDRRDKLERFNNFIFLLAAFFGIYGIIEFIFFPNISFKGELFFIRTRVKSIFVHPNTYAGYLDLTIPFVFAFAIYLKKKINKIFLWCLFILLYINMILTFSRASFLTVNLALLIMVVLRYGKKAFWIWLLMIGILVLIGTTTPLIQRQLTLFGTAKLTQQQLDIFRVYEYFNLLDGIKNKPIFGSGLGSKTMGMYVTLAKLGHYEKSYHPVKVMYAHHSMLLDIAGRMGIPVLFSFIMVFITTFIALCRAYKFTSDEYLKANIFGVIGALIAFSPHQIVDNFIDGNIFIYFIFILSIGIVAWRYVHNLED
jgi:O-antigen ligase